MSGFVEGIDRSQSSLFPAHSAEPRQCSVLQRSGEVRTWRSSRRTVEPDPSRSRGFCLVIIPKRRCLAKIARRPAFQPVVQGSY
jgi:hypothetical protein